MNEYLTTVGSSLADEDLSTKDIAEAMKVAGGPSENIRPINVGLMFFNDDPSNFFREAIIEVVDIPDPTGEGMTERTFRGPLNYQLENALAYIKNSIVAEKVFKHPDRAEATRVLNYPYPAIEEALSNAVYHKSYQIPEPITIRIEKDNLSILSVPGPDRSISDEDIKRNHLKAKRYRNRRIGEFLKELDLIEERGTGVPTMLKSLHKNGSAPPTFTTDEDRSFFEVKFDIHPAFIECTSPSDKGNEPKKRRSRQEISEAILRILEEGAYSQSELRQILGYSSISRTMTAVVDSLLKEGLIRYTTENERDPRAKLVLND